MEMLRFIVSATTAVMLSIFLHFSVWANESPETSPTAKNPTSESSTAEIATPENLTSQASAPENETSQAPAPDQVAEAALQVLIDPGHGGIDKGGITIGNTYEEPIVFDVATKLLNELSTLNIKAELIRESDEGLGLEERVQVALQKRPQIFISLHANTHRNKRIRGAEFYIEPSKSLLGHQDFLSFLSVTTQSSMSDSIMKSYNTRFYYPDIDELDLNKDLKVILLDMVRMKTRGESLSLAVALKKSWKGSSQIREGNFYLLRSLPYTSVLVELGYISNEADFKQLSDETKRLELAKQLAKGLSQYLSTSNANSVKE